MANGYQMFEKLHPVGGLYRCKDPFPDDPWKFGKVYLLTKWEVPEGLSEKSPLPC
jgi:hypothetical protein